MPTWLAWWRADGQLIVDASPGFDASKAATPLSRRPSEHHLGLGLIWWRWPGGKPPPPPRREQSGWLT